MPVPAERGRSAFLAPAVSPRAGRASSWPAASAAGGLPIGGGPGHGGDPLGEPRRLSDEPAGGPRRRPDPDRDDHDAQGHDRRSRSTAASKAPIATGNFVALAGCGYYNGVVFQPARPGLRDPGRRRRVRPGRRRRQAVGVRRRPGRQRRPRLHDRRRPAADGLQPGARSRWPGRPPPTPRIRSSSSSSPMSAARR